MCISCAMMASSVTLPTEDEGAKVDRAVDAGRATVAVQGCFSRSCVALRRTVATSMAHMKVKWGDLG